MSQQFRNIVYLSDRSGTGKWRRIWPIQTIDCLAQSCNVQADYSQSPIVDVKYYQGMTSVTLQRWISDSQVNIVEAFLKPIMDASGGWIIYEIDDNMSDKYIPFFNRGRKAFEGSHVQSNIKKLLNLSDFVTVTTDYLKNFYHEEYGVPLENIIAIPNFLPKFLFGDRYDLNKKIEQFKKFKAKPRIGLVSSLSHYNVDNVREDSNGKAVRLMVNSDQTKHWINEDGAEVNESETTKITDDFDEISELVRNTIQDFQWVIFGYCPPQIEDLARKGKVEIHQSVPIMNYASIFEQLQLQAVVAPIKRMTFNYSKSFIKYMECAALGVPCYATNCLPYDRIMPEQQLFNTSEDLKDKLLKLKNMSVGAYTKLVENQWKWLNTPCCEGDFNIKNFWLEDNIDIWLNLFKLRSKTLTISLNSFIIQNEERKKKEAEKILYKNDNILITK